MSQEAVVTPGRSLPTGTVTFLRTDVEGSMRLVRELGTAWDDVNAAHIELIRRAVSERGGMVVRTEGDATFAVFPEARAAVGAAIAAQRTLDAHPWPDGVAVRVRMGLHSGEAYLAAVQMRLLALQEQRLSRGAEADRLRAVSHLVMGVAHELNTPLEIINQAAELVARDPAAAAAAHPGVAVHLAACGPCHEDLTGLLAAIRGPR